MIEGLIWSLSEVCSKQKLSLCIKQSWLGVEGKFGKPNDPLDGGRHFHKGEIGR